LFISFAELGDDSSQAKPFLKCEYNCYGDSHRSPWSNQYFPAVEMQEGEEDELIYPSAELLEMEQMANEVFHRYAKLYYDQDFHTSVYFFDTDDNGFGSCWLVKKNLKYPGTEEDCIWDATHVVKTTMEAGQKAKYKVTSTVFLTLNTTNEAQGQLDMAGNVTRFKEDLIQLDPKQNENQ